MSFKGSVLYRTYELVANRKNISHKEAIHITELDFTVSETGLHYIWKKTCANGIKHIGNDFIGELAKFIEIDEDLHSNTIKDSSVGTD
jgi:hypothetical protein